MKISSIPDVSFFGMIGWMILASIVISLIGLIISFFSDDEAKIVKITGGLGGLANGIIFLWWILCMLKDCKKER